MQVKRQMRYFNEYLFHELIHSINESRKERGESVILTSQARHLHKQFVQKLAEMDKTSDKKCTIEDAGQSVFAMVANEILSEVNQGQPVLDGTDGVNRYKFYVNQFRNLTGFGAQQQPRFPVLPLSPYDERFSGRAVFRQNGSRLLFARGDDVDLDGETFGQDMDLYKMTSDNKLRKAGTALTQDDYSGMSMLMPYISQRDYNSVANWVNKVGEKDPNKYMSKEAIERSCAILQTLQDEGTAYTIECDENVGQIKACLTGTKISIRLTDSRENEKFIGRVYDDGFAIYYTTNKKEPNSNRTLPYMNPTAKDCIRLLHFAQGKSIDRNDTNEPSGKVKTYTRGITAKVKGSATYQDVLFNEAYHSGKNYSAVVGVYPGDSRSRVLIHVDSNRSASSMYFKDSATAEAYLRDAVTSARENFVNAVNVDMLVKEATKHANDETYTPPFSGDSGIATIQKSYWDVLVGRQSDVLRPGFELDEYKSRMDILKETDLQDSVVGSYMMSDMVYSGSPEEKVRKHLLDNTDYLIGQFDLDSDGKRFDPVNVASYMSSEFGKYRNNDNMVAALRASHFAIDELKGNDFYNKTVKDKMIRFDATTARPMAQISNPFVQTMFHEIKNTINETGCTVNDKDILMDENGIVHYTAERVTVEKVRFDGTSTTPVTGEIGQIFIPDDLGLVETKFAGTDNYLFTPGYEAYVIPQKDGEHKSLEERTRLKGYEQIMRDSIRYQIRSDMLTDGSSVGSPTSVNDAYRRLYDTRYPLDFVTQSHLDGMSDDLLQDIVKTNASRVRYSNEFKEGSTINADYQSNISTDDNDPANDNYQDYYRLTGGRNMSIMTHDGDGYFDPSATGTSTNQGITRYLVESCRVTPDGEMIRGDLDDKTPLMKNEVCKYMDYIPFDRRQMTFNNLLKASCVADKVHTAQMTFGGWGFDDGYVVSKEFAEKYPIRGSGNKMRPLMKGDKISDMNGNKGVISLIVDRNMDLEEADKQNLRKPVEWFKANPELEVVGAPFPAPSRFNGGSARELMEHPEDLVSPDGTVYEGCMGTTHYIITHMPVDEKTHVYGEDELAQGKGRKASAQLAWALASQNCTNVLTEFYSSNNGATSNLREMLITMGMDMDEVGNLRVGYQPHPGEERQVFKMAELEYKTVKNRKTGVDEQKVDVASMKRKFGDIISQNGGLLEIPFELKYPNGQPVPPLNDGKTDVIYAKDEWTRKGYFRKDGTWVKPTTVHRHDDANTQRNGGQITYGLPVLSAYLRSGQEFADGTSSVHDYTNHYLRIYEASLNYRDAQNKGDDATMERYQRAAQAEYDKITRDLEIRKFSGKHNLFRDDIMANRLSKSATAVWTADPRLDIDQVAMGSEMAKSLGLKENDYTMIWRDPMLRDAGTRYMRVFIDNSLTGIAINPVMDKSFDGDFDGDSAGAAALQTKVAKMEAMQKLTVDANLLDYGIKNPETGKYELMMQNSLDMKSAAFTNPELAEWRQKITDEVNAYEQAGLSSKELAEKRRKTVLELSDYVQSSFADEYGTDMICFKDMKSHMKSVEHMVIDGAKGSYSKLEDYAKYLGVEYNRVDASVDPTQPIDLDSIIDNHRPRATREDDMAVQYATAVKAFGTGVAGMFSQRGVSALRNTCPKAVLELTYPVTQSILQSKHDPIEARHKYEMLMSTGRDLWRGVKLDKMEDAKTGAIYWKAARDEKGRTIQATPEQFKTQFMDIYTSKDGLNVEINEDYVDMIRDGLTGADGLMMNIEREGKETGAAVMDKLAYGGTVDTLYEAAVNGENLFEGQYNQYFAPNSIRKNQARLEAGEETKAIVKSDVKVGNKPKVKKPSVVTVNNTSRLQIDTSSIEANAAAMKEASACDGIDY